MVRQRPGRGRHFVQHPARQVPHPARPLRLRQDHDADEHRRPARHRRRLDPRRRRHLHVEGRGPVPAAGEARHRHGVPELRDLAAHDGGAERRLSAGNPQSRRRPRSATAWPRCCGWSVSPTWPTSSRRSSPAASSSARRWRARSCRGRGCCCSTSRCPTSISSCASRCGSSSSASSTRSASPRSTSPTTRPRRWS